MKDTFIESVKEELAERELELRIFKKTGEIFKEHIIHGFNETLLSVGAIVKLKTSCEDGFNTESGRYFIKNRQIDKLELIDFNGRSLVLGVDDFDTTKKSTLR